MNVTCGGNTTSDVYNVSSRTFKVVFAILLGGIGVLGNTFIIFLTAKITARKSLHHLIINLSLADLFLVIVTETQLFRKLYIVEAKDSPSLLSKALCPTLTFLRDGLFLVVVLTLFIVSIERFRATRQTLRILRPYPIKRRVAMLVLVWLLSMGFCCTFTFHTQAIERIGSSFRCTYVKEKAVAWFTLYFVIVAIPHALIYILSFLILKKLSKPNEIETNLPEEQRKARAKRMRRVVKMIISSQVLFGFSYLPLSAIALWGLFTLDEHKFQIYMVDTQYSTLNFVWEFALPLVNSSASPYIYLYFLSDFKEAAKKCLSSILAVIHLKKQQGCEVNDHRQHTMKTTSL